MAGTRRGPAQRLASLSHLPTPSPPPPQVINPATGETIAAVANCRGNETRAAIAEASSVFEPWAQRTGKARAAILRRWYEEVVAARDDITRLMTLECGKPLAESRQEFDSGCEGGAGAPGGDGRPRRARARVSGPHTAGRSSPSSQSRAGQHAALPLRPTPPCSVASIEWFAEEAKRSCGDVLESPDRAKRFLVTRSPVGVVGAITPWNFPFSMITRKVSPALAAGCTVVLKPSELTPLTALALGALAERAGMPRGVLNLVVGEAKAIGDALIKSEEVRQGAAGGAGGWGGCD